MQRFLSSKIFNSCIRTTYHKRLNSTVVKSSKRSLIETLNDARYYFGDDKNISRKIESLKKIVPKNSSGDYTNFEPTTISLGIVQSPALKQGLFLDTLLSDPYSITSTHELIKQFRLKNPQANIKVIYGAEDKAVKGGIFTSKTSILNHEMRLIQDAKPGDGSSKLLNRDLFNDFSFIEINDKTFSKHVNIDGAESLDLATDLKDSEIKESDCQIIIYVTSFGSILDVINDTPSIWINNVPSNNTDLNIGTELETVNDENIFEIDLQKLNHANSLISDNIQKVSEYLLLYQQSNINELLYTLNRETSGYKPQIFLLKSLLKDLKINESSDVELAKHLKEEITEWAQQSHFELQSKVSPFLENVLLKRFSKLTQLIINSGDLTLVIPNLLNGTRVKFKGGFFQDEIECYGSLEDATAKSHYLQGRIDALFPDNKDKGGVLKKDIDDYLIELKNEVSTKKLPEVQSEINKYLIEEVIAGPFTLFALTNVGYIYDIVSLNTVVAITTLSIAITASMSQKKAISILTKFNDWYLEKLRLYIDTTAITLGKKLEANIKSYEDSQFKKKAIINELKDILYELENADFTLKNGKKE